MRRTISFLLSGVVCVAAGCGSGALNSGRVQSRVASPHGIVHGGQQPIAGAAINLYEVGTNGYGSAPTLLYSTPSPTGSDGSFSFPLLAWNINCTNLGGSNSDAPVYITSTGGSTGAGANSAIVLMAALGPCNNINSSTYVVINEATTVAAAYALGQFMNPSNPTQIGYLSSQTGIQNAFTTAGNLANVTTGTANALTPNGNGAIPQLEINTLADILAYCVNGTSGTCTTLESDAFNSSGGALGTSFTTPTNTLMAAQQIAAYPGYNASTLYGLASGTPPFEPKLLSAPNDWTLAVLYAANGADQSTNQRVSLAVDASDNVWIANQNESNVEMINNQGVPGFSPVMNNISTPTGLAIDFQGNAWVANAGNNEVYALCFGGGQCGNIYSATSGCNNNNGCGISNPYWLTFDGSGNLWVVNNGTPSLSELFDVGNSSNNNGSYAVYTPSSVTNPLFLAIDTLGNAWVADDGSNRSGIDAVEKISAHGVGLAKTTGSGLSDPQDVAIDHSGNIWVGNDVVPALTKYNSSGAVQSGGSGFTGGGLNDPTVLVVDGANRIWTANGGNNSISVFSNDGTPISPSTGYTSRSLNGTSWLAIDKAGDVWVSSSNPATVPGTVLYGAITEFVGAAAPVITPLAQAVSNGQLGVAPGTPVPVTILTSSLPYYAITAGGFSHPYDAQLQASGGSGSYSWSTSSSGALTAAGLSLSSAGLISGTPTESGPLVINVTVADSTNPSNSASTILTLNSADQMALSPGANDSELKGTYTFLIQGINDAANSAGAAPMTLYAGTMTANGTGNLTGEFDFNNSKKGFDSGSSGPIAFTGYYTVNANNIGQMSILPDVTGQNALNFAFSAGTLNGTPAYQNLEIIRYDDTGVSVSGTGTNEVGGGFAKLQTATTLATGSWVFGFSGETPCTTAGGNSSCAAGLTTPYGPLSAAGVFTVDGSNGVTAGEEDASSICPQSASSCTGYNYNAPTISGSYVSADGNGRGTAVLTPTGTLYPDAPTNFVYYVISPTEVVMISKDSHIAYSMVGGDVDLQQGTIGNSTLANGVTMIPYGTGASNGDGESIYPAQAGTQIVLATVTNPDNANCSGGPSFNVFVYQNGNGNYQAGAQGTLCFSIASNGRFTFTSGGGGAPVGYVAGSNLVFLSQTVKGPGDGPGLLRAEPQTATTFSSSSCDVFFGTLPPPTLVTVDVGYASSGTCPTTSFATTDDYSDAYGVLGTESGTLNTSTPDGSGVITGVTDSLGNNRVIVVISATKGLTLDSNQGDTTPFLSVQQK